jgi:phosphonate transport system substrate-binding protein
MIVHRRRFIAASGFAAVSTFCRPTIAQTKKLHFGVGPLLPSPDDTKKAYAPVFAHLAKELGADFDLVSTTDWAGMAVAMGSGQLDVALDGSLGVRDRQFRDQLPGRCHREV